MSLALVTGSAGLIGSESVAFLHQQGFEILGLDNDLRGHFFGKAHSTALIAQYLTKTFKGYRHIQEDIRNRQAITKLFQTYGKDLQLIVHCAAQPSHDWASKDPVMDFDINASATLYLLEATRLFCPEATFIFTSTNKVYGDTPNRLPLQQQEKRWECHKDHPFFQHGIDETMSIDASLHSLFGVSKTAADLLCQEYGRYFALKTAIFRCGCLTGPQHQGAKDHGFLSYLSRCYQQKIPYEIYGYEGKQVRDNLHSADLIAAFWQFYLKPRPAEIYNLGGGRLNSCSVLEAMDLLEQLGGQAMPYRLRQEARQGDHQWWITDHRKFQSHYPSWRPQYNLQLLFEALLESQQPSKIQG